MKVMEKIFLKFSAPSFETDMILLGHPNEIYFKMESILLLYLFLKRITNSGRKYGNYWNK